MPTLPLITLTATSSDSTGVPIPAPAMLRIILAGYGLSIPVIPGVCTIDQVVKDVPFSNAGTLSVQLWGNDVITPAGTWYCIVSYDATGNLVGAADYQFTGTETIDLSNAVPLTSYGGIMPFLQVLPCTGNVPGATYVAPGPVIGILYNGIFQRPFTTAALPYDYTLTGTKQINLNFSTLIGDSVYALCIA